MPEILSYPLPDPTPPFPDVPVHRWATVVQASPLRVRLDGDDDVLLSDPWDMAGPRRVGERVYCQIANRRVVIIGPNGHSSPDAVVNLTAYLDTSLWTPYGSATVAAELIRWGPLIQIAGAVSPKAGHPWLGLTGSNSGQPILTGLPAKYRMRLSPTTADAGFPRQPMSGNGSWYTYWSGVTAGMLAGSRVAAASAIATDTWFPFGIWGYAEDSF